MAIALSTKAPAVAPVCAAALSTTPASATQELGLNAHQSIDVGLDITRDAGLGWVRIDLNWFQAEPQGPGPDFSLFDTIVNEATTRGLKVLAVVGYGPEWASTGDALQDGFINDVPKADSYAAFVAATVAHFQDRVTHYELWNEPNLDQFFEGSAQDYTSQVLVPGADAVHSACPSCQVVAPGIATVGDEYAAYMDASLAAAKDRIDIVSGHIYADFSDSKLQDNFFNKLEEHRVVDIGGTVVFEGQLSFREAMQKHGVTAPFWLTETGYSAPFGDGAEEQKQLLHYRHVLEAMLTRPWWHTTIFYEAFDLAGYGNHWGVALADGDAPLGYWPKPVMALLQKVSAAQPAFGGSGADCDDGLDNEGDGLVDYPDDPDCASATGSSEGVPPTSDGGSGAGGAGGSGGRADDAGPAVSSGCDCATRPSGSPTIPRLAMLVAILGVVARRRRGVRVGAHSEPLPSCSRREMGGKVIRPTP